MVCAVRDSHRFLLVASTAALFVLAVAGATPAGLGVPPPVPGQLGGLPFPHRVETNAAAAARDSAGRVVVTGYARVAPADVLGLALARFAESGGPDASFGYGGAVTSTAVGAGQVVTALPDGKLLVGSSTNLRGFVERFSSDGRLDGTFGSGGVFAGPDLRSDTSPEALAVTPLADGTIVAVFVAPQPTLAGGGPVSGGLAFVRLTPDGRVLSRAGYSAPEWVADKSNAYAAWSGAHVYADGSLVVAGSMASPFKLPCPCEVHSQFVVRRFLPNGTVDRAFGSGGRVTTTIGTDSYADSLAVGPDGKIVVAGSTGKGAGGTFAVARYGPDGSLDPTFGHAGIATVPDGDTEAISVAPDGSIFIGSRSSGDLIVIKLDAAGVLAAGFGNGGRASSAGTGPVRALLADADRGVTVVAYENAAGAIAVVRYLPSGAHDTAFGLRRAPLGAPPQGLLAVATRGSTIAAAGFVTDDAGRRGVHVVLVGEGQLAASFGNKGETDAFIGDRAQATAVGIDPSGRVVVGGEATVGGATHWFAARFRRDGSLDPAFGSGGVTMPLADSQSETVADIAVLDDSRALVLVRGAAGDFLIRLTEGGAVDLGFGEAGRVALPLPGANALVALAGGGAVVAGDGLAGVWIGPSGAVVKRAGAVVAGAVAAGLVAQRDGSLVVTGTTATGIALVRRLSDATLDTSFGRGGITTRDGLEAADVAVQRDGRIVVAVRERGTPQFAVARFLYDGRIDERFGNGGLARTQPGAVASAVAVVPDEIVVAGTTPSLRGTDSALALLSQVSLVSRVEAVLFHVTPHGVARRIGPGTQPAWSSVAGSLAYVGDDDGAQAIALRARSGASRQLAGSPLPGGAVVSGAPQWSRDGKLIVVQLLDADGTSSVGVVNATGGVRRIDAGINAAWLDGHRLVYVASGQKVRLADADTGVTRPLTTGWDVSTPPRGQLLAVADRSGWMVVRANGAVVRRLPGLRDAHWAPDGRRLAGFDHGKLAIVDLHGRKRLLSAAVGAEARVPTWSPDGRLIAFVNRPGRYSVTFVNVRTGKKVGRWAPGGGFDHANPSWDATGVYIPTS